MQTSTACLPRTIVLSRPWPLRWWDAAVQRLQGWRSRRAASRRGRELHWDAGVAAQFSDRVLIDIGAPDWVRAEAAARREAERFELAALRGKSGLFDRGF